MLVLKVVDRLASAIATAVSPASDCNPPVPNSGGTTPAPSVAPNVAAAVDSGRVGICGVGTRIIADPAGGGDATMRTGGVGDEASFGGDDEKREDGSREEEDDDE